MKRKNFCLIIIGVVLLVLILIPKTLIYEDGGSKEYKAILYSVTKYHVMNPESTKGYDDGWKIKILGITVYDELNTYVEAKNNETLLNVSEIENVKISIQDVSSTGATVIIKDTNENPYTYGEWYKIEREENKKWVDVPVVIKGNYGFNEIAYIVNENNEVKFTIDWKWLYGELPSGSYRILKQVNNKYISVEFNLATTSN